MLAACFPGRVVYTVEAFAADGESFNPASFVFATESLPPAANVLLAAGLPRAWVLDYFLRRTGRQRRDKRTGVCAWAAWALGDGGNRRRRDETRSHSFSGCQPANRPGDGLREARISAQWPVPQRSGSTFGGGRWLRGKSCAALCGLRVSVSRTSQGTDSA